MTSTHVLLIIFGIFFIVFGVFAQTKNITINPGGVGYTVGTWHQYAFTRTGAAASATITAYQDGIQVNTTTTSITDPASFSNDLVLGSYRLNDAVSGLYLMNQSFGPIYFYRRALTAQEIFENWNSIRSRYRR